jgi:DNA ligase D-like protein (predicted ligase)
VAKAIQKPPPKHPAHFVEPMQCLAVAKLPEGPDWEYELKFDGYRALGIRSAGRVRLMSRNGNDFSARFPSAANALSKLPDDTIIDGEIVALDESGRPSVNVLQNYNHSAIPLEFYVFDILHLAGKNLRNRRLDERRELLRAKTMPRLSGEIRFSETLKASAAELVAAVKKQGLEGVIAKRLTSLYEPGRRSGAWVKMRINKGIELVIGGYVPTGKNFDSVIVGYYERNDLIYVARVRNGFVPALRAKVFERFHKLEIETCPFSNLPQRDKRQVGSGSDDRQDGRMPLAEAATGSADRVRGLDRREPSAPLEIHNPARRQAGEGRAPRAAGRLTASSPTFFAVKNGCGSPLE